MKRVLIIFLATGLAALTASAASTKEWETDYAAAAARAKAENKTLLLDFTGSDWCVWCMKLEKEVFSKKEFKDYAAASLVCVLVDFPQQKQQPAKVRKQNAELQKKYSIRAYPSVLLLTPAGDLITKTGYEPGGPAPYVEQLKQYIADYQKAHPAPAGK